jgi:hypothetical protein
MQISRGRVGAVRLLHFAAAQLSRAGHVSGDTLYLARRRGRQPEKRKVGGSAPPLTTTQAPARGLVTRPNVMQCWSPLRSLVAERTLKVLIVCGLHSVPPKEEMRDHDQQSRVAP